MLYRKGLEAGEVAQQAEHWQCRDEDGVHIPNGPIKSGCEGGGGGDPREQAGQPQSSGSSGRPRLHL